LTHNGGFPYTPPDLEQVLITYEDSGECLQFLEGVLASQEDKEKVYSLNARQVGITA
jgi:hypothetical protein